MERLETIAGVSLLILSIVLAILGDGGRAIIDSYYFNGDLIPRNVWILGSARGAFTLIDDGGAV